ncbi:hypothetical protein FNH22_03950 [Fulvivirga sp. M361]|uniref:SprT-like domain-containing protein n=1 Tax=Fulvivirga sp. M361 TaxID=2594266 RepID=UPI00117AF3B6|nr:SprT-like domain-containing protein [Fulvivirga sp. M361]TRX61217.1 hypothetical protein FNH22_03950 [Fulvivirga sp. M361]
MRERETLRRFFPEAVLTYCLELWHHYAFTFKITRKRATKLGDYKYHPSSKKHTITVNNDLNSYAFLVTYLHEVAHLITYKSHGRSVLPHGKEWKNAFREVMQPVLNTNVFPGDLLYQLQRYLENPKASSCNDHALTSALARYDKYPGTILKDIEPGSLFKHGKKTYQKEALRRTRYICKEVKSGRRYLISKSAPVEPLTVTPPGGNG